MALGVALVVAVPFSVASLTLPWVGFAVLVWATDERSPDESADPIGRWEWVVVGSLGCWCAALVLTTVWVGGPSFADAVILPTATTSWSSLYFGDPLRPSLVGNLIWLAAWIWGGLWWLVLTRAVLMVAYVALVFTALRSAASPVVALVLTAMTAMAWTTLSLFVELGAYATSLTMIAAGVVAMTRGCSDRRVVVFLGLASLDLPVVLAMLVGWTWGKGRPALNRRSLGVMAFALSFGPAALRALVHHSQGTHGPVAHPWLVAGFGPLALWVAWWAWRSGARWRPAATSLALGAGSSWTLSVAQVLPGERYLVYLAPLMLTLSLVAVIRFAERGSIDLGPGARGLLAVILAPALGVEVVRWASVDEVGLGAWRFWVAGGALLFTARVLVDRPAFRLTPGERGRLIWVTTAVGIWLTLAQASSRVRDRMDVLTWWRTVGESLHDRVRDDVAVSVGSRRVWGLLYRTSPTLIPGGWGELEREREPLAAFRESFDGSCDTAVWVGLASERSVACVDCATRWTSEADSSGAQALLLDCPR